MKSAIQSAIKSGHGAGVLYAGMLGLLISDLVPTPADAFYFRDQQKLRAKFEKGEITAKKYWIKETTNYYGMNALWWAGVLFGVTLIKGDFEKKFRVAIGLLAAGAIIGVVGKNIQIDAELQKKLTYNSEKFQ